MISREEIKILVLEVDGFRGGRFSERTFVLECNLIAKREIMTLDSSKFLLRILVLYIWSL